jgi:hypothetical protein
MVAASSLNDVPDNTAYILLDPQEATVAPDETHVFTVGAYDSSDNFLGDVTGANGISVFLDSGEGSCDYQSGPQVYRCGAGSTGDFTVVATFNDGGCQPTGLAPVCDETGPQAFPTAGIDQTTAILHVTDAGGTSTTVECSTSPCDVPPITGDPTSPDAVNSLSHLVLGGGDVTATADFIPGEGVVSHCGSSNPVGDAVDVRLYGNNLDSITLTMTTIIIIPKATLQAAHDERKPLDRFNICFGAAYLPGDGISSDAWLAKGSGHQKLVPASGPEFDGTFQRFWGIAANCKAKGLPAEDPCIQLRTKHAKDLYRVAPWASSSGLMHDGDLAIVIRTMAPWDGKGGVYS